MSGLEIGAATAAPGGVLAGVLGAVHLWVERPLLKILPRAA